MTDQDLYARGWESGVEQARRILSVRLDDPAEALSMIHDLLIDGHRSRKDRSAALKGGRMERPC